MLNHSLVAGSVLRTFNPDVAVSLMDTQAKSCAQADQWRLSEMKSTFVSNQAFYLEGVNKIEQIWKCGMLMTGTMFHSWDSLKSSYQQGLYSACTHWTAISDAFKQVKENGGDFAVLIGTLGRLKCNHSSISEKANSLLVGLLISKNYDEAKEDWKDSTTEQVLDFSNKEMYSFLSSNYTAFLDSGLPAGFKLDDHDAV